MEGISFKSKQETFVVQTNGVLLAGKTYFSLEHSIKWSGPFISAPDLKEETGRIGA